VDVFRGRNGGGRAGKEVDPAAAEFEHLGRVVEAAHHAAHHHLPGATGRLGHQGGQGVRLNGHVGVEQPHVRILVFQQAQKQVVAGGKSPVAGCFEEQHPLA
jgi:hypothetical protein